MQKSITPSKKTFLLTFLFGILLLISACDHWPFCKTSGDELVTQTIDMKKYSGIILIDDNSRIVFRQDDRRITETTANENTIKKLSLLARTGILEIEMLDCDYEHGPIDIEIRNPEIKEIKIDGPSVFEAYENIETESIKCEAINEAEITIEDLSANIVKSIVRGDSRINLSGEKQATRHDVIIRDNGILNAARIPVREYIVNISGKGTCRINVTSSLSGEISGDAVVYYKGDPEINLKISGNGRAIRID